ncbi:MAG: thioredoxin domain-containing protein [Myxococcota bacterium]
MTNSFKISVVALSAVLALIGCKQDATTSGGAGSGSTTAAVSGENPSMVVAKYGDKTLTLKEVDATIAPQLKQMEKQKLELRQRAAEQMALQEMVKAEAAKVGQTEEQWFKANVDAKLPPPSEEQIKKVFDENQARMPPGATIDSMREQIIGFLQNDQKRDVTLKAFDELKAKNKFQLLLEEPRVVVEAKGPSRGPADAKVTIVEFSDFECPFCSKAEDSVSKVMEQYAGKVKLVFRHYPLPFHSHAAKAAEASACADEQGKFWEMHKVLFANQQKLGVDDLKAHAATVGLDAAKFAACLDGGGKKSIVDADQKAGTEAGVTGTPAFFINGKLLSGALPVAEFQKIIDAELAK